MIAVSTPGARTALKFKVLAFFSANYDVAHISFAHEANKWFPKMAAPGSDSTYAPLTPNRLTGTGITTRIWAADPLREV